MGVIGITVGKLLRGIVFPVFRLVEPFMKPHLQSAHLESCFLVESHGWQAASLRDHLNRLGAIFKEPAKRSLDQTVTNMLTTRGGVHGDQPNIALSIIEMTGNIGFGSFAGQVLRHKNLLGVPCQTVLDPDLVQTIAIFPGKVWICIEASIVVAVSGDGLQGWQILLPSSSNSVVG